MQKRLLFLGASYFQIPPLVYAKRQGHYIITCDYLPDNPGHKYADEYHNISITDHEEVLKLAERLKIDGVVAYGSDPAAATAAYVAAELNLPGNPYESVRILSRKDLYRDFLKKHHFCVPKAGSFSSFSPAETFVASMDFPVVVKPVDGSGSKGVTIINSADQLKAAYDYAISFSRVKKIIIEEYIQRKGYQIAGDGFVRDKKLVFRCFAQEHFLPIGNPCVPVGESFPLTLPEKLQAKIHDEVDRLMSLLHMKIGGLNFDIMLNENDDVYLMEVGPRNGGNLISEIIKYSTGIDLVKYVVDGALGLDCNELAMYDKAEYYSSYILNSKKSGLFRRLDIHPSIENNIIEKLLFVKEGMPVKSYNNSGDTVGCIILKFDSSREMLEKMESMSDKLHVMVS